MQKNTPLVSIGMPLYNEEKMVSWALESLISQTYSNIEISISDNCSTDNTLNICNTYAKRDKRISINRNKKNMGIVENFLHVLKKSKGKYFMWAAGDDHYTPEFIETLVHELESYPFAGAAFCATSVLSTDKTFIRNIRFVESDNLNELSPWKTAGFLLSPKKGIKRKKYPLLMYSLFKREAINEILSLEKEILYHGERNFLFLFALKYKFRYIDKLLFNKTDRGNFSVRNPDDEYRQIKKRTNILDYYFSFYFKLIKCIFKMEDISLTNRLFCLNLINWYLFRYGKKKKKKIAKIIQRNHA